MAVRAQLDEPAPRKFTTAEFEQMGRAGIFPEGDRVELINGEVVQMVPIGSNHAGRVGRLTRFFVSRLADRAYVSPQSPIILGDHTEPQPDLVLARPRADDYTGGHPTPESIFAIIEVAETSARYDRETKSLLYAAAGIPELWVVDLSAGAVIVYRSPGPAGYRDVQERTRGDHIAPLAFADCEIAVGEILR